MKPEPPECLSDGEAMEWRAIVERMPADFFPRECHAVLVQYCRHVEEAERLQVLIRAMQQEPDFDLPNYQKVLGMRAKESVTIAQLAKTLKIDDSRNVW